MTVSGFRFPSASGKHEHSLGYRIIYSRKNWKQIESLLNHRRSFIEGSSRFRRTQLSPRKPSIIRVSSKLLEATLFQGQLFKGWSSSEDQGNVHSVDIHRQNW